MQLSMSGVSVLRIVTLASASGRYGGPFDTAARQANLVSHLGARPTVLAGYLDGDEPLSPFPDHVETRFVKVSKWLKLPGFSGLFSVRIFRSLWREIRLNNVVHISISRELIPICSLVLAIFFRKKIICQPHGMLTSRTSFAHRTFDVILRKLIRKSDYIIALTSVESELIKCWDSRLEDRLIILGNPVAPGITAVERRNPARMEALFVARLHARKRVGKFIDAAAHSAMFGWNYDYTIVGPDGGDKILVESAVEKIPYVRYEGALTADEVTKRVADTGVFVLPSENEPWGNVLALALASGIPVVVCKSAALSTQIQNYGAGIVVPDGDGESISRAVREILSEAKLYHTASLGALVLAETLLGDNSQYEYLSKMYT